MRIWKYPFKIVVTTIDGETKKAGRDFYTISDYSIEGVKIKVIALDSRDNAVQWIGNSKNKKTTLK